MTDPGSRHNPYDFVSDIKDRNLFAGRRTELSSISEELAGLTATPSISPVVALVGERRVGKTSLLNRISEVCIESAILSCWINVTNAAAADPGEFWLEVFARLLFTASKAGIISLEPAAERWSMLRQDVGFKPSRDAGLVGTSQEHDSNSIPGLRLAAWYEGRRVVPSVPPTTMVSQDLDALCQIVLRTHYKGILFMFDEAHLLLESLDIVQQLRYALRESPRCGFVFAGEKRLNQMFTDSAAPFYLQARIIPVQNFASTPDVAECALLPLNDAERTR